MDRHPHGDGDQRTTGGPSDEAASELSFLVFSVGLFLFCGDSLSSSLSTFGVSRKYISRYSIA
jgi:hypothetical protein